MIGSPLASPNSSPEVSPRSILPSPCRIAVGSEHDREAPDLSDERHWEEALKEVSQGLHAQKCQAFASVHATVLKAAVAAKGVPPELQVECRQAAIELEEAMADPKKGLEGFQVVISRAVRWINGQPSDQNHPNASHGGALGDEIFQHVIGGHTVPIAQAWLARFVPDTKDLPFSARALAASACVRVMFDGVAQDRQAVAMMSDTENPHRFGARYADMHMHVSDHVVSWPAWGEKMFRKFESMATLDWEQYRSCHSKPTFSGFLLERRIPDGHRQIAEFHDKAENAVLEYDVTDARSGEGRFVPRSNSEGISFFTFKWSANPDGTIRFSRLYCIHANGSEVDAEEEIVPDVLATLDWKPDLGIDHLKQSLAKILYKFSHSSTFERGQASIVETIMKAIALHHNYKLEFDPAWSQPNPQPDQHALSEFNIAQFVVNAAPHLVLTRA